MLGIICQAGDAALKYVKIWDCHAQISNSNVMFIQLSSWIVSFQDISKLVAIVLSLFGLKCGLQDLGALTLCPSQTSGHYVPRRESENRGVGLCFKGHGVHWDWS